MDSQSHQSSPVERSGWADQRDYKPKFIMWHERDFREDRTVQRMTPHQRAMYRNLLMECYYGDERPFLTSDDNLLWIFAEADNLEDWIANKPLIMSKFKVNDGGLLSNKRVLLEWDISIEKMRQHQNAGRASAEARRKRISLDDKDKTPAEEKKEERNLTQPNISALNGRSTDVQRPLEVGEERAANSSLSNTENPNQGDLLEKMARSYTDFHGGFLNRGGKQKILDLRKSYDDVTIERGWTHWVEVRDLEGLKCPLSVFADEFPQVLEVTQKEQDFAAVARLNQKAENETEQGYEQMRRLNSEPDLEADVIAWAKKLRAVAEQPSLNGCTRGSDAWEDELCEWVKKNSPPVLNLHSYDWRADETLGLEIQRARFEYEHPERKSFDLLKMFGVRPPDPNGERWQGDLSVV